MRSRVLHFCLLVVIAMSAGVDRVSASDAVIRKLLEDGWQPTGAARADADRLYKEAAAAAPSDTRALVAYCLVLMQQRRYDDALPRLNEYLAKQPSSWMGVYAKTWVEAVLQKNQEALTSAERLTELIANQQASHEERVEFLGKVFGFLAGPLEKKTDQAELKRIEAQVVARFDERRQSIFTAARDDVIKEFKDLAGDADEAIAEAKKTAEEGKQQALAKLGEKGNELADKGKEIDEAAKKAAEQLKKEQDRLKDHFAELVRRGNILQQQSVYLQQQYDNFRSDVNRIENAAKRDKTNPNSDSGYRQALNAQRSALGQLNTVKLQMQQNLTERNTLVAQNAGLLAEAGAKGQQLQNQQGALAKEQRKLELEEKRSKLKKAATSAKARSLDTQARAFSTYDQFPLDKYKKVLVNSLKPQP